uniref:Cytochrome c oxidase subunit 2 n=1 Tax=Platevindex mortoni TaxID=637517 RepID=D3YHQ3_9EUPU|nr:cytochrome c oxidase subunit II [Platevindex mortoni]ADD37173.1 cytochrome c oxidase subunit II [Platevindex mortoni]UZH97745.1 cytochrome c oxidase subunit 2 [Platevindex mortoni]
MSVWGQLNLMDPASPIQAEMLLFHDHAMVLLIGIFSFVALIGLKLLFNKFSTRTMHEAQQLETIWTVVPALLLIWLALPSLRLLYLLDESSSNGIVLKSTGHQWYWSYEIPSIGVESFDSYMIQEPDLNTGDYRLLEVDNRATVPYNMNTTVITTSADVLHAWALPSVGVKMDAVPGRLNSMGMFVEKPGVYYGQCSEICGANHSFMPIVVEAVSVKDFLA